MKEENYSQEGIMNHVDFIIKMDGSDIEKGLDLFEFAPSLLSLGTVVKESSKIIGIKKEIGINIKPIEKGSFLIELAFFTNNGLSLNELFKFTQDNDVKNIKEVLEWIGLIGGGCTVVATSLIQFIKWRDKNKNAKREEVEPNKIKYTENDQSITVNGNVENIYNSPVVHQHIYPALRQLEKSGIDTFESYIKGEESNKTTLTPDDVQPIKRYSESELSSAEEVGEESVYETSLNFKRGSFEGEPNQWSFRKGDQIIVAVIRDEEFLGRIKDGEVRPYTKDFLKVTIKEIPKLSGTEIRSVSYEILEVKEYKKYEVKRLFNLT